jgi:hypothetical protein
VAHIVLVPNVPAGLVLDVIMHTPRGYVVQVSDTELEVLHTRGVAAAELYASGNDWAAAVHGRTATEALAAITDRQDTAIAALDAAEQGQFGVV